MKIGLSSPNTELVGTANQLSGNTAGPSRATAAQGAMAASGEQWTPLRAAVFEAIALSSVPASAYDIVEKASSIVGRRLSATSVYRILELFTGANLVTRVESQNAFVVNDHPLRRHDCIFLVCDHCGVATHIDDDNAVNHVRTAANATGFKVERPVIEMRGRCTTCAT